MTDSANEGSANPLSVLVVDDNPTLRDALAEALRAAGYKVFQASNGDIAIAYTRQHSASLLITDLVMPDREGLETIRAFGKEFPLIPIIAISGKPEFLPLAKALGAKVVLGKPFAHADLMRAVRDLLGAP